MSTPLPSYEARLISFSRNWPGLSPHSRLNRYLTWKSWWDPWPSSGVDSSRIELDLGFGRGIGFYTQMIFELVVPTPAGPIEVCGGGRYDGLARVLGSDRDERGAGFAFGLERLADVRQRHAEVGAIVKDARLMSRELIDPIRLALPSKGHLYEGTIELLKTAGYKVRRPSDRQYEATIAGHGRFHVVFMRPADIVIQVQEGAAILASRAWMCFPSRPTLPTNRSWLFLTWDTAGAASQSPCPKAG